MCRAGRRQVEDGEAGQEVLLLRHGAVVVLMLIVHHHHVAHQTHYQHIDAEQERLLPSARMHAHRHKHTHKKYAT